MFLSEASSINSEVSVTTFDDLDTESNLTSENTCLLTLWN